MRRNIKRIIAIITIFSLVGCSTTTTRPTKMFDSRNIEKQNITIDNFNATKSRGALFVQGRVINKSGSELENIELEARGYNKNGVLISTDRIDLVPSRLKNNGKVSFNATFTRNIDQIDSYYFVGKFESIKTAIKVDWRTLGVILLSAGAIAAISTAAYYGKPSYGSTYSAPSQQSIYIDGYYRDNGTYVRPHYRTYPDDFIDNNYGLPSPQQAEQFKSYAVLPTYLYDFDSDGITNQYDIDDDNDGVIDNRDKAPYNKFYY